MAQNHGTWPKSRYSRRSWIRDFLANDVHAICNWYSRVHYLPSLLYTVKRVHTTRCRLFPKLGTFWHLIGCYTFLLLSYGNVIGDIDVPSWEQFSQQTWKMQRNYNPVVVLFSSLQPNRGRHANETQMWNLHQSWDRDAENNVISKRGRPRFEWRPRFVGLIPEFRPRFAVITSATTTTTTTTTYSATNSSSSSCYYYYYYYNNY